MNEKEMINDYLAGLNAGLAAYGGIITQCSNPELRQALQTIRNDDETRQYNVYRTAKEKGYYTPAAQATEQEIQTVKTELENA